MAKLCIWWGKQAPGTDALASGYPCFMAPGSPEGSAETLTSLATSTQSSPAPYFGGEKTIAVAIAIGGTVWITAGETASVEGADCLPVKDGQVMPVGLPVGQRLAAIQEG